MEGGIMDLIDVVRLLTETKLRKAEGFFSINTVSYKFTAYKITNPQNIIRIDIKEAKNV